MLKTWTLAGLLALSLTLAGCGEEAKKAEDRGRVPKRILDKAKKDVDATTAKIQEGLNKMEKTDE